MRVYLNATVKYGKFSSRMSLRPVIEVIKRSAKNVASILQFSNDKWRCDSQLNNVLGGRTEFCLFVCGFQPLCQTSIMTILLSPRPHRVTRSLPFYSLNLHKFPVFLNYDFFHMNSLFIHAKALFPDISIIPYGVF